MQILKKTPQLNFLKYKWIALGITLVIVVAGLVNILVGTGLKLGVDFGEGTLIRVVFKNPISVAEVRGLLSEVGLGGGIIQETGRESREFQIRAIETRSTTSQEEDIESHQILADRIIEALQGKEDQQRLAQGWLDLNNINRNSLAELLRDAFPGQEEILANRIIDYRTSHGIISSWDELKGNQVNLPDEVISFLQSKTFLGNLTVLSRETVGPQVGKDLRKKATQAIIWSLIGMLVYIAFRFKGVEYGSAAIFTLAQDVLITLSIYSFTNREINLPIIAALLTIVGYSSNDTIVIFDRIRELRRTKRRESLENIMNLSLNLNLSRTLITSGTLFVVVLVLFLFGGEVINDFAFIMLIGTIEGVYSTIFLSCPVVLIWHKYFKKKKLNK
ncbi:MAG: protein translocase subunit SecF [Acidobacteriota bacterium]|nr:protein translocase subunit SecF [Acidobacteriota bacterium]MDW3229426.1 protein translocase subunit SecF [Acidobacteriota bacterium]MDY0232000.1 protein translocase subunit SecF [Candidatus Saccharicenans sp.]